MSENKEESMYIPTEEAIKQLLHGEEEYFNEAAKIIAEWYETEAELSEGSRFESEEEFLEDGYMDIMELIDAQYDMDKVRIAWLAFDGIDIDDEDFDDEDFEDEDDFNSEDFDDDDFEDEEDVDF